VSIPLPNLHKVEDSSFCFSSALRLSGVESNQLELDPRILEWIFEIPLAADTEKNDRTEIGYAVLVQWHGYPTRVLYSERIFNLKGKFVQCESASVAVLTLERSDIAGAVACRTRMLERHMDLHSPAATRLIARQTDLHGQCPEPLRLGLCGPVNEIPQSLKHLIESRTIAPEWRLRKYAP
jgi:hypothetical protein